MAAMQLTRTHRILIGLVVTGAVIIAAIGFAGSYAAVRELAESKGFGRFSSSSPSESTRASVYCSPSICC